MGGTYLSVRLPVRRPLVTGRYCKNRLSTVDFDRWQPIEGEIDRRRSIEGEKGKKKNKRKRRKKKKRRRTYFPCDVLAHESSPPSPAGAFSPVRGETFRLPPRGERSRRCARNFVKTYKENKNDLSLTDDPKKNTKNWQIPVYTLDGEES
ncbi:hypothetical protein BHM03_00026424 [Ensete ventricosum]|nr:hypothetical protein BHM03_00026424 [Ensete ventricosum]